MAKRIPQSLIDQIIDGTDIVGLIGERVQLKKAGRDWKGLCPFHGEKTPSFTVSQEKGLYHCFGCKAGGNALTFLMELDKLEFTEAIETLAQRAGIALVWEGSDEGGKPERKDTSLYGLLERAADYYRRLLLQDPEAEAARTYAEKRGLVDDVAETFAVGWAPTGWQRLRDKLKNSGVNPRDALEAGLVQRREERGPISWENLRDKFVDRLMFPIHDGRGRVVGFGGRALREGQQPKYMNSATGALFHKGKTLYNLHRARKEITDEAGVIVVEGYMDLIALHRAGIKNAVATLGTALTADHSRLIRRYTRRITILFDSDEAGRTAAFKSLEVLLPAGLDSRAVFLESGKDPDELLAAEGPQALLAQIEQGRPLLAGFIESILARVNHNDLAGKQQALLEAAPVLAKIESAAVRDETLRRFAFALDLSEDAVRMELRKAFRAARSPRPQQQGRPSERPAASRLSPAEHTLLALYLQSPLARERIDAEIGEPETLVSNDVGCTLLSHARTLAPDSEPEHFGAKLLTRLESAEISDEVRALAQALLTRPLALSEEEQPQALSDTLHELHREKLRTERRTLQAQLAQSGAQPDPAVAQRLLDVERQLRQ